MAARRRSTYLGRVGAAFVPIAIAGFWMPVLAAQFSTQEGRLLFGALSALAFGYCLLAGTRVTADCISSEKRDGTIGLLFLTDLKGYDVILGKLVSSSVTALYALLGTVPVLALALLLGGVTLDEVGRTALLFANTLFFSMSAGVFASTLSRNDRKAAFATACLIGFACAGPYALGWIYAFSRWMIYGPGPGSFMEIADLLRPSPVFAFQILRSNAVLPGMLSEFYQSILLTLSLSWILLGLASVIVPRVCRERPPQKAGLRWLNFRNRWSYGAPEKRRRFRKRLLAQNAFYWLAARDRIKAHYVWLFVGALALIWVWSGWLLQSFIFDWDVSLIVLYLLFGFLKVWLTSEVCTRVAEDRASGAYELLLSSPMQPSLMARGVSLALWRQFGRPVLAILLLSWLLLRSALRSPHSGLAEGEVKTLFWSLMLMLIADLWALKWVGMWLAATRRHVNQATMATWARVLVLPSLVFLVVQTLVILFEHVLQSGSAADDHWIGGRSALLWLGLGLTTDGLLGFHARWRYLHQLRDAVAQQYAPPAGLQPFLVYIHALRARLFGAPEPKAAAVGTGFGWRKWAIALPLLTILAGWASLAFWRAWSHRQVEIKLATIRAAGQPVTLSSLQNWGNRSGPDENAARYLQKSAVYLRSMRVWSGVPAPGVKLEWPGRTGAVSPESLARMEGIVRSNRTALDLIHSTVNLRQSRFAMSWQNMPASMVTWQEFAPFHAAIQLFEFEALLGMQANDTRRVLDAIDGLLAIARALSQEPYMAAAYHRQWQLRGAGRILERLLNQEALDPPTLDRLLVKFAQAEQSTASTLANGLIGERCLVIHDYGSPTATSTWFGAPTPTAAQKAWLDAVAYGSTISGLKDRQLLQLLHGYDDVIRRAEALGTAQAVAGFSVAAEGRVPPRLRCRRLLRLDLDRTTGTHRLVAKCATCPGSREFSNEPPAPAAILV